jgi:hypothetical protein
LSISTALFKDDPRPETSDPEAEQVGCILNRPEMLALNRDIKWVIRDDLAVGFEMHDPCNVRLSRQALQHKTEAVIHLRHALELAWLTRAEDIDPVLAGMAAARTAALFAWLEGLNPRRPWSHLFLRDPPPSSAAMKDAWDQIAMHQPGIRGSLSSAACDVLSDCWSMLGPVEILMQRGGDNRLYVNPETGLNVYGCSHRPRPWAVTFASSTASSISERGYIAAEAVRQRVTLAALRGLGREAVASEAALARREIKSYYRLPPGAEIVLAPSGTDGELFALAIAQLDAGGRAISNMLIAPEETGSGVPLAARGRHFATDTAIGSVVEKGAVVTGFDERTTLVEIRLNQPDGSMRPMAAIDEDCNQAVAHAIAEGRKILLHILDVSKRGRAAPSLEGVKAICGRYGEAVDVVVDACQARLSSAAVRACVEAGWLVLVTGSKFFTGPPFSGALLVPPAMVARLERQPLPTGLRGYTSGAEWPGLPAAAPLREDANYGLVLRWHAALGEMTAFAAVPPARRRAILERFCTSVRCMIEQSPDLLMLPVPPLARPDSEDNWDTIPTIASFGILAPEEGGQPRALLDPTRARQVYQWLNADLSGILSETASLSEREIAVQRCHIGQPVPVETEGGTVVGVLRISAGARVVSGEPSHAGLREEERVGREIDSVRIIVAKISLILRQFERLQTSDPQPSF